MRITGASGTVKLAKKEAKPAAPAKKVETKAEKKTVTKSTAPKKAATAVSFPSLLCQF